MRVPLVAVIVILSPAFASLPPVSADHTASGCEVAYTSLLLVLDRSGSMAGAPLAAAKQGADALLARFNHVQRSGLVSYSDSARLNQAMTIDHARTRAAVAGLVAGGATGTG